MRKQLQSIHERCYQISSQNARPSSFHHFRKKEECGIPIWRHSFSGKAMFKV